MSATNGEIHSVRWLQMIDINEGKRAFFDGHVGA